MGISCVISTISCVCVISAMDDGNCSEGEVGEVQQLVCKSPCGERVTSGGE